ncbi:molybdenum cofactor guanylyltransferase [Thalassotalea aquiviva]|uniref:molybdenum cofactor guanylyltransferase n=1 Tax=Thalassotalea aquiviva TaxID=3242415 RepID=UPI00352B967F
MKMIGVVLAGGRSSRMGQDKALLAHKNVNMLAFSEKVLRDCGCDEVLISRNEKGFIQDSIENVGPLGGIYSVLNHLEADAWLVILPVDLPCIDAQTLATLLNYSTAHSKASYYADHPLPCVVPYSIELKQQLKDRLTQTHKRSVKSMLHWLGAHELTVQSQTRLINTNTPEEWQNVTHQLKHHSRSHYGM